MLIANANNVFGQRAGMTPPQAPMANAGGPVASPIMAGRFRPQMPMQQFGGPTPGMDPAAMNFMRARMMGTM
jgi:hypothetical protein